MEEILLRVALGGVLVSTFAALGDMLKPKSFAGLFRAAPSIALASLSLAVIQRGTSYASVEARSMALGAVAFCLCAWLASRLLIRGQCGALVSTGLALVVWVACAFGLWSAILR